MDLYATTFDLIDFRSFSNLWYWIILAVFWSTASHFVLGVPYDMVTGVNRGGDRAAIMERDLEDLVRIQTNRLLYIFDIAGFWLMTFGFFWISGLAILGFWYGVEFCQALFFIVAPMSVVFAASVRCARLIRAESGQELRLRLRRHRVVVQVIGMFSILVTSLWGMFYNINLAVL